MLDARLLVLGDRDGPVAAERVFRFIGRAGWEDETLSARFALGVSSARHVRRGNAPCGCTIYKKLVFVWSPRGARAVTHPPRTAVLCLSIQVAWRKDRDRAACMQRMLLLSKQTERKKEKTPTNKTKVCQESLGHMYCHAICRVVTKNKVHKDTAVGVMIDVGCAHSR